MENIINIAQAANCIIKPLDPKVLKTASYSSGISITRKIDDQEIDVMNDDQQYVISNRAGLSKIISIKEERKLQDFVTAFCESGIVKKRVKFLKVFSREAVGTVDKQGNFLS